jgi:hypothetical protein
VWLALLALLPLLPLLPIAALGCGPRHSRASRHHARPWSADLAPLFDDANDVCTPWVGGQETWAKDEQEHHAARTRRADIVAHGVVRDLVDTGLSRANPQLSFHFHVEKMLRGELRDLPGAGRRVVLRIDPQQPSRLTRGIVGREAVLFLRWRPTGEPAFHWHVNCVVPGVVERTRALLRARDGDGNGNGSGNGKRTKP